MYVNELKHGRTWLIRLETGQPLYAQLMEAATSLEVDAATLTVFGAVENAVVRTYNQAAKRYDDTRIDEPMELLSGIGNFSLRDGARFLHCHISASKADGTVVGGHLHEEEPTRVFVGEVWLQEMLGEPPVRVMDERCGLMLW